MLRFATIFEPRGDPEIMSPDRAFHWEVEKAKEKDERGNQVTAVRCHGRLISETASEVKEVVKPLISQGGRIIVDLGDVSQLDSSGLGALVGLKASAIHQGYCILEFKNMTPRVLELLRITHLTQMFSS
jgi:anti-anti-sigma factor